MLFDISIIVLVNVLFFFRTIWYGMIIDDQAAFVVGHNLMQERMKTQSEAKTFWIDLWRQFKQDYILDPRVGHAFSFLMHMINCVLIYFVFGANEISLLAALLFAINPVNNQAAVWLSGRTYSIATSIVLLGVILYRIFPVFYGLMFMWSINGFMSPLLFLMSDVPLLALTIFPMAYLMRRRYLGTMRARIATVTPVMKKFDYKKILLFFKTFAYYTTLCLFPLRIGMCHSYLHTYGLSDEETKPWHKIDVFFILGVALFIGIGWYVYTFGFKESMPLLWWVILIVQWCNLIVINHPITERYCYLANVGLMYLIA
ncbi:MAG: hypothetical protein KKC77_19570, partial [Proteobacteria bacterium]|nr:hypothetical protein [Pseudomonadota bacterium]